MKDWSKVERYSNFVGSSAMRPSNKGIWVQAESFDSLLTELRETRRAFENTAKEANFCSSKHFSYATKTLEEWLSEARTELDEDAMKESTK